MVKVESKENIKLLTKCFMQMNRNRNMIAVLAIMLTTLLFTSLFVGVQSLILSKRATDIRSFMDSSHASARNLTKKEAAAAELALEKDEEVLRFGKSIFLGSGVNPEFSFSAEVRYADENMAESFSALPTKGRLPEQENEIAVSTLVLDALGLPHKLGTEVKITWEKTPKEQQTDTFVVSGYYEGDKMVLTQMIWVSQAFARDNQYEVTKEDVGNGIYNGVMEYTVWYNNLVRLNKNTENLSREAGFKEGTGFEVNPAYDMMEEDSLSLWSVVILILFILAAGYLIIYNIFNISIKTDIRVYGLLKNVGMTGRQLKKIVHKQALWLSAIGIPIGLLAGYIVAVFMAPSLTTSAEISAQAEQISETVVKADPLVFLLAALLSLLTVYLSCLKACHIVKKVSPVEALRIGCESRIKRKVKRNSLVSWYGMAVQNMLRNWKMGIIVMLSIALSMVVVNCIVILVRGCDFDAYKEVIMAADFQIDQVSSTPSATNFNGVGGKLKKQITNCPDSKRIGYVYYSEEKHEIEPHLMETLRTYNEKYQDEWGDYGKKTWEKLIESNQVKIHLVGINEGAFEKLDWRSKACSWEEFAKGEAVLCDYCDQYSSKPVSYYKMGETFAMKYQSGKEKEYTVLGEAVLPYALDYPYGDYLYLTIFVPEKEYIENVGNDGAMYAAIDAKKGKEKAVWQYLYDVIQSENSIINMSSVLDMKESFLRYLKKYYMIGTMLVIILAFIGIMNYFNTISTSILSRKKELALLEVVGMTKKQIVKMLILEGLLYLGGAFLLAIIIVHVGAVYILAHTVGNAFFFSMHVTILPCILLIPVLILVAVSIPKISFKRMCMESVVDRIRME